MFAPVRTWLCLLALLLSWHALAQDMPRGMLGLDPRPAPALRLKDLDGKPFDLAQARGQWVMVHFWASWCGPCRKEMPTLETLRRAAIPHLRVVLVNTAEDEDTAFSFLASVAPELTTLLDPDGAATDAWQPRGLPSTYLVDPQGRLRYLALGGRDWGSAAFVGFLRALPPR
jgi:thiol-disulfide isomerase/thioredoxin